MGFGKVGIGKVGFGKVGIGKVGFGKVGIGKVRFGEVGFGEVGGHRSDEPTLFLKSNTTASSIKLLILGKYLCLAMPNYFLLAILTNFKVH